MESFGHLGQKGQKSSFRESRPGIDSLQWLMDARGAQLQAADAGLEAEGFVLGIAGFRGCVQGFWVQVSGFMV